MRPTTSAGLNPTFARRAGAHRFDAAQRPFARRGQYSQRPIATASDVLAHTTLHDERNPRNGKSQRPRATEAITRRVLIAVRVAMGVLLVACGVSSVLGLHPAHGGAAIHDGALAFASALMLTGSLLPLLKGTEVIVETMLETLTGSKQ